MSLYTLILGTGYNKYYILRCKDIIYITYIMYKYYNNKRKILFFYYLILLCYNK